MDENGGVVGFEWVPPGGRTVCGVGFGEEGDLDSVCVKELVKFMVCGSEKSFACVPLQDVDALAACQERLAGLGGLLASADGVEPRRWSSSEVDVGDLFGALVRVPTVMNPSSSVMFLL